MNYKKLAVALSTSLFCLASHADVVGGTLEVSYWNANYSGTFVSDDQKADLEDDLGLDDSGATEFAASVEHPVPVLPNIKVKHISLDASEDGELNITFDDLNFTGPVSTDLDLTHSDVILYWEVLDNYVSIDLGLDVKIFDGELIIESTAGPAQKSETTIDEVVPMLYGAASVELPLTGLSLGVDLSALSVSGDSLLDGKFRIRQDISLAFVELGYRQFSVDIEDVSDIDIDAEVSGAYVSVGLDF